ncbi:MAG: nickel pincer cofactor biosynthesis protein LarB [Nitrospiria bacterium]
MYRFDHGRQARIGLSEAILCEGKPYDIVNRMVLELACEGAPLLLTRLDSDTFRMLETKATGLLNYEPESRTAFLNGICPPIKTGRVAVVAAGTSDRTVALEVCRTLEYLGVERLLVEDVGVAAIWRIQERIEEINHYEVVIVVAGMDGALASVMGGLTPRPLIAVPTSVGYGAAGGGEAALRSMLASCAPGVPVMNIDNGYGAACAAFRIIRMIRRDTT